MRKVVLGIVAALLLVTGYAGAQETVPQWRGIGVGGILGEPTGGSLKVWLNETAAIDAALAWSFGDEEGVAHADYLFHNNNVFRAPSAQGGAVPLYYGVGIVTRFTSDTIAIRVPIGIDYIFEDKPYDVFFEIAPVKDIVQGNEFKINWAVGARYYYR